MTKPDRSETAAPAVSTPLDCGVGRPVPERATVGDVVACDVSIPYPQTLHMKLETQAAADHANTLLTLEPKVWWLEKRI